jgi:hypothetical protein
VEGADIPTAQQDANRRTGQENRMSRSGLAAAAAVPIAFSVLGCLRHTLAGQSTEEAASTRIVVQPVRLERSHESFPHSDARPALPATPRPRAESASLTQARIGPADTPARPPEPPPPDPELPEPDEEPEDDEEDEAPPSLRERLGLKLSLTGIYQAAVGGHSRPNCARPTADYELVLAPQPWPGGRLALRIEGTFGRGPDAVLDSLAGLNERAEGTREIVVTELWLEQQFAEGQIKLALGKLDLRRHFDTNRAAHDATRQFLSAAFVNNPTIAWPAEGLGLRLELARYGWPYYAVGIANALARRDTLGMDRLDDGRWFFIHELGVRSRVGKLHGDYKLIFWHRHDGGIDQAAGTPTGGRRGWALGFDQQLPGRLTLFGRYGVTSGRTERIGRHWSVGLLREGPIPGRDRDALGVALGGIELGDEFRRAAGGPLGTEVLFEVFYRAAVTDWLELSFDVQLIDNPGGRSDDDPVVLLGLRCRVHF